MSTKYEWMKLAMLVNVKDWAQNVNEWYSTGNAYKCKWLITKLEQMMVIMLVDAKEYAGKVNEWCF